MDNHASDMMLDSDFDEKPQEEVENVHVITPNDADSVMDDQDVAAEIVLPSAADHEAMRDRFLPLIADQDTEDETIFTWDITDWRHLPPKVHSPIFRCAGSPWRILFFPAGNQASDSVSFYLEQAHGENEKAPEDWHACAQFMLVLQNTGDPSIYLHHEACHRFTVEEGDWGFTRFAEKTRIFSLKSGIGDRPLVENDCATMTAYVRILKDPTGVLWHNFVNYDSKKETGMVGLRNQGATCYLNSLLQSLYLTNAFRQAVYQIPTETEQAGGNASSAYALQRLFYRLQSEPIAVSTQELTHSFGWESRQIFEQQDVQELSRILMERLEERMKGTDAENALAQMFVGKMKTYLKCIHVNYESSRIEDFWDLQLNVSGCKSVEDSFRDYIQVETLEGDNKYAAEGYGLQDAKKGVIFESFPNVLHLQLKRFEYDFQRDAMMKVNDRYEFPEILDLEPYLDEAADKSEPYTYHLHGVLVHSGDLNAGHYYAYLKPQKNGEFYRFDDDRVTRARKREAIDENFGGDYATASNGQQTKAQNPYTRQWSTKRSNNAYMLVYIRESRLDQILLPESQIHPPSHLPVRLAEERALAEKRRKERDEAHLYMNVMVATEANFRAYEGLDFIPWSAASSEDNPAAPKILRLLKAMTVGDFTRLLAEQLGLEQDLIRPWCIVNRQNSTARPDNPLVQSDMTLSEAADKFSTRNGGFRVFVEETSRGEGGQPIWPNQDALVSSQPSANDHASKFIIIFLKHFDVDKQRLRGAGHVYMHPHDKVADVAPHILKIMGWEAGVQLELYEEIKHNHIERKKPKSTLVASEIQDGDIICFQRHLSEAEAAMIKQTNPTACLDAPAQYDFLVNQIDIKFCPRFPSAAINELREEGSERFSLTLSRKDTYEALAHKVAEHLSTISKAPISPTHLRFSTVGNAGKPRAPIRPQHSGTLSTMIYGQGGYGGYYTPNPFAENLLYEILEMSLADYEQRRLVRVFWLSEGITKEEEQEMLVHKQGRFTDVLQALQKKIELPDDALEQIRFYLVHYNKVHQVLPITQSLADLNDFVTICAERVPEEEQTLDPEKGDKLAHCFHFEKEPNKTHGVPFVFLLKGGEIFKETKERLSKRTGLKGKNLEKIRFAIVSSNSSYAKPQWIEDDDILADKLGVNEHLGLEHPNRNRQPWMKHESLNIR
ncbi:cysteine proteinase [Piedraia hortae CBS 480.64]|uniref:ubiquitinyl hydrolase 1 n=1 Tax=Piedraia hortae CBS 480.64 TaxID=1314780 RepID=A0A6A7BX02_9PEZI|nr:cysteine proteinase [Piedraia hortae CBS 480.64]